MQIREMNLKELHEIYELIKQLYGGLSYDEFENLIYDMRHIGYKMFGLFERGELISFAGVCVVTTLMHKRHLLIFEIVTDEPWRFMGYAKLMLNFLEDYAKSAMCQKIVAHTVFDYEDAQKFYEKRGFLEERLGISKEV